MNDFVTELRKFRLVGVPGTPSKTTRSTCVGFLFTSSETRKHKQQRDDHDERQRRRFDCQFDTDGGPLGASCAYSN